MFSGTGKKLKKPFFGILIEYSTLRIAKITCTSLLRKISKLVTDTHTRTQTSNDMQNGTLLSILMIFFTYGQDGKPFTFISRTVSKTTGHVFLKYFGDATRCHYVSRMYQTVKQLSLRLNVGIGCDAWVRLEHDGDRHLVVRQHFLQPDEIELV